MKNTISLLLLCLIATSAYAQQPFITTWGVTANDLEIAIPANTSLATYNYNVDFGDGTVVNNATNFVTHTYDTAGIYTVTISGTFPRVDWTANALVNGFNRRQLFTVEQWGDMQWSSMNHAFAYCLNLTIPATDTPDLSMVTSMSGMFRNDTAFNNNINHWDVSHVTEMQFLFEGAEKFNQPLNNWNVANVVNMEGMFKTAFAFNQPLNDWNVGQVTNMKETFSSAAAFNGDISSWNTASVTNMDKMFFHAAAFNQPVNSWNVSNVTNMDALFAGASSFNQPLNNWDISGITLAANMFTDASSFNQSLNNWNVSQITHMQGMFSGATAFNQPLNNWDVANTTAMSGMFEDAASFNQDISGWAFNGMVVLGAFVKNTGLSVANYDALLEKFDAIGLTNNMEFKADNLKYCNDSARANLINSGWNISGDAKDSNCMPTSLPEFLNAKNTIHIYPNPAGNYIHIEAEGQYITAVTILNIDGRQQIKSGGPMAELYVGNLSPGIYVITISTKDGNINKKLVKQ